MARLINPNIMRVEKKVAKKLTTRISNSKNIAKPKDEPKILSNSVKSSNLKHIDYNVKTKELTITFNNMRKYVYKNVQKMSHTGLLNAASKGEYFEKYIRYKYKYREI